MKVTLSFEAADAIYNRLRALDETLELGFNDAGSKAFEELRRELARCKREHEATQKMEEMSCRATKVDS